MCRECLPLAGFVGQVDVGQLDAVEAGLEIGCARSKVDEIPESDYIRGVWLNGNVFLVHAKLGVCGRGVAHEVDGIAGQGPVGNIDGAVIVSSALLIVGVVDCDLRRDAPVAPSAEFGVADEVLAVLRRG